MLSGISVYSHQYHYKHFQHYLHHLVRLQFQLNNVSTTQPYVHTPFHNYPRYTCDIKHVFECSCCHLLCPSNRSILWLAGIWSQEKDNAAKTSLSNVINGFSTAPPTLNVYQEEMTIVAGRVLQIQCLGERHLNWTLPYSKVGQ